MNLSNLNVQEMNKNEMVKTEGGIWPYLLGAAIVIFAVGAYNGYKDTEQAGKH